MGTDADGFEADTEQTCRDRPGTNADTDRPGRLVANASGLADHSSRHSRDSLHAGAWSTVACPDSDAVPRPEIRSSPTPPAQPGSPGPPGPPAPPTRARRRVAAGYLLAAAPIQVIGTWLAMVAYPDAGWSKAAFAAAKVTLMLVPVIWLLRVDRRRPRIPRWSNRGMLAAHVTGGLIFAIIAIGYYAVGRYWIDAEAMREQVTTNGLGTPLLFLLGALYWCTINSMLEEYFWRWFISDRLVETMPAGLMGRSWWGFRTGDLVAAVGFGAAFHRPPCRRPVHAGGRPHQRRGLGRRVRGRTDVVASVPAAPQHLRVLGQPRLRRHHHFLSGLPHPVWLGSVLKLPREPRASENRHSQGDEPSPSRSCGEVRQRSERRFSPTRRPVGVLKRYLVRRRVLNGGLPRVGNRCGRRPRRAGFASERVSPPTSKGGRDTRPATKTAPLAFPRARLHFTLLVLLSGSEKTQA